MKNRIGWMMLVVVALVSTSAWAALPWQPSADSNLVFNMNFETTTNGPPPTTTDAKAGLVGTLYDYNATNYNIWQTGKVGKDANFSEMFDKRPDDRPNDCKIRVADNSFSIFDLSGGGVGGNYNLKRTYTFWFNMWKKEPNDTNEPNLPVSEGTIIRHANTYAGDNNFTDYTKLWWEIRIYSGKLHFYHANNCLKMETENSLESMGVLTNKWHHAAVVINRTTETSSKIYIDGLERPVTVTQHNFDNADVDTFGEPLQIGAGDRQFDGLLDEILLFTDELIPLQVSILYQLDGTENPIALEPFPRSKNVIIGTGLSWVPDPCATRQTLYFDDDNDVRTAPLYTVSGDGNDMNSATNGAIGGPLDFNSTYYWVVDTNVNGTMIQGPLWSFTTETGKAINVYPADGEEDIAISEANLYWTTPTAAKYDVYFADSEANIVANEPGVRIATNIADTNIRDVNAIRPISRGTAYFWRVDSNYPTEGLIKGDIWRFRTDPYEIVFNTKNAPTTYADHDFNALECVLHTAGWTLLTTGSVDANIGTAANPLDPNGGLAVFNFTDVNGFNYNSRYAIVVIPNYNYKDIIGGDDYTAGAEANVPRPLAIHVTNGNFYFDGRINLNGDDVVTAEHPRARSGGFPGPKANSGEPTASPKPVATFWTASTLALIPTGSYGRFGIIASPKSVCFPTDYAKTVYGPGVPVNPPYKGGGGGGYGGIGGDCGRGYFFGVFSGGPSYGDEEVPIPFGGSAGGWGASPDGASGGGGIEIVAAGNVVLDSNSQIKANGGNQLFAAADYPAGGGAGGSVKIIADGNVVIKGDITANGGIGGQGSGQENDNDTGGGGAGGRIAIFYGAGYTKTGSITADGGARGTDGKGTGLAQDGQDGTIYEVNSLVVSLRKASAPTPKNGDKMVYAPVADTNLILKWYSGYNVTPVSEVVLFGTTSNPTVQIGLPVSATRGQHSSTEDVNITAGQIYYWKVVTNGTVSSDVWSFKAVGWQCPVVDANDPTDLHIAGPRWDTNGDCVLDEQDFAFFAKDWRNSEFGNNTLDNTYVGNLPGDSIASDLLRFVSEWLDCRARTKDGCNGW